MRHCHQSSHVHFCGRLSASLATVSVSPCSFWCRAGVCVYIVFVSVVLSPERTRFCNCVVLKCANTPRCCISCNDTQSAKRTILGTRYHAALNHVRIYKAHMQATDKDNSAPNLHKWHIPGSDSEAGLTVHRQKVQCATRKNFTAQVYGPGLTTV